MTASLLPHVAVIGAGFTGLAAGYELMRHGIRVSVLEREPRVGGLAGSFLIGDQPVEMFYHHWFTNDRHVTELIADLGSADRVVLRPTRTGLYYANSIYRLSTPWDVVRFGPLPIADRLRLGLGVVRARRIRDWRTLESVTASSWLQAVFGRRAYRVVWEPLLVGKFGLYADDVSAAWFWKKLALRGTSRGRGGAEILAYYRGGFAALAELVATAIAAGGGSVHTDIAVDRVVVRDGRARAVASGERVVDADAVLITTALPIAADLMEPHAEPSYVASLRRVNYLANVCLVLVLDRSLSETYWLNVNDPSFPFVGVIEHTNFEPPPTYGGRHIVYLSKYLPPDADLYTLPPDQVLAFSLPHIRRMFPTFDPSWIVDYHVWRAPYAQPIVERGYGGLIPGNRTPIDRLYLCTMAQVYPEDRGTNYAIRDGRRIAGVIAADVTAAG